MELNIIALKCAKFCYVQSLPLSIPIYYYYPIRIVLQLHFRNIKMEEERQSGNIFL